MKLTPSALVIGQCHEYRLRSATPDLFEMRSIEPGNEGGRDATRSPVDVCPEPLQKTGRSCVEVRTKPRTGAD